MVHHAKWQVYEQILKVPNYVVFDRYKNKLWCFKLTDDGYQERKVDERRYWIEERGIGSGIWQGEYEGVARPWLRWYDANGDWIPNKDERIEQARSRAEQERSRREETERENIQLKGRLRTLGIDPDEL